MKSRFADVRKNILEENKTSPKGEDKASAVHPEGSEFIIRLSIDNEYIATDAYQTELSKLKETVFRRISLIAFRSAYGSKKKPDEGKMKTFVVMLNAKATTDKKSEGLIIDAFDHSVKTFLFEELKTPLINQLTACDNLKHLNSGLIEYSGSKSGFAKERFIENVLRTIDENISNFEFDVCMLHKQVGISRMHLSRKLKILTGLSPHILIRNIRLEKAAELLLRKEGNITEIANSVGISNPSGFSRAFREYFGVSPKNFFRQ